jgi:hypothetical protein
MSERIYYDFDNTKRPLVRFSRDGACSVCEKGLDWYDSKWVEQAEPFRMVCFDCGTSKECSGWPKEEYRSWFYYTDG